MLDAVVMTLGFEPGPLISTVASAAAEGLSEGARVIVFTVAFPDERSDRAWRQLQNVVGMMELPKRLRVRLERCEVPLEDFVEAVRYIKRVLSELREGRVKISITGGMRAVGLAVFAAYLLIEWRFEPRLEVYLEGRGVALSVPEVRRLFKLAVAGEKAELIKAMRPGEVYRPTGLALVLGKDRSTVYRHLKALVEMGVVERRNGGYAMSRAGLLLI